VFMVASCAGAALGCYLVSLNVAPSARRSRTSRTDRLAQRDIRLLQTEIGTRGRLAQLERWNVKVLACRRRLPTSSWKADSSWRASRARNRSIMSRPRGARLGARAASPIRSALRTSRGGDGAGALRAGAQLMREASLKLPEHDEVSRYPRRTELQSRQRCRT
jgi:hypothetical protein